MRVSLFFEHQSIKRALANAGLIEKSESQESSPESTVPVFLGWSSQESLMLNPQYALLSLDGIRYVRLPQPYEFLREIIGKAAESYEDTRALEYLQTPLGQWRWALDQLHDSLVFNDRKVCILRLAELKRFAAKHWPGYYESFLTELSVARDANADIAERVALLESNAKTVAMLFVCQPIMSWVEDDAKANHIATMKDIVAYLEQGAFDTREIRRFISDFVWTKQLESDFSITADSMNAIHLTGCESETTLGRRMELMRNAISEIRKLANKLLTDNHIDLGAAKIALDTISQVAKELIELRSNIRLALAR